MRCARLTALAEAVNLCEAAGGPRMTLWVVSCVDVLSKHHVGGGGALEQFHRFGDSPKPTNYMSTTREER